MATSTRGQLPIRKNKRTVNEENIRGAKSMRLRLFVENKKISTKYYCFCPRKCDMIKRDFWLEAEQKKIDRKAG